MTVFRLKSGGGSSYFALIWSVVLLLVGIYFLLTSLWQPSLLTLVWLALTLTCAFFVLRAVQHVQNLRSGNYPVAVEIGAEEFSVVYASHRIETHGYREVLHGDGQGMEGLQSVSLQLKDGTRYHFDVIDAEFPALAGALEQVLGERFAVFEGERKARKDMFK